MLFVYENIIDMALIIDLLDISECNQIYNALSEFELYAESTLNKMAAIVVEFSRMKSYFKSYRPIIEEKCKIANEFDPEVFEEKAFEACSKLAQCTKVMGHEFNVTGENMKGRTKELINVVREDFAVALRNLSTLNEHCTNYKNNLQEAFDEADWHHKSLKRLTEGISNDNEDTVLEDTSPLKSQKNKKKRPNKTIVEDNDDDEWVEEDNEFANDLCNGKNGSARSRNQMADRNKKRRKSCSDAPKIDQFLLKSRSSTTGKSLVVTGTSKMGSTRREDVSSFGYDANGGFIAPEDGDDNDNGEMYLSESEVEESDEKEMVLQKLTDVDDCEESGTHRSRNLRSSVASYSSSSSMCRKESIANRSRELRSSVTSSSSLSKVSGGISTSMTSALGSLVEERYQTHVTRRRSAAALSRDDDVVDVDAKHMVDLT